MTPTSSRIPTDQARARTTWFAAAASALAESARPGSLARKAALCVAVALNNSKTTTGAHKVLAEVRPDDVREAARRLLDHIIETEG